MDLNEHIKAVLAAHPVVLFMKGTLEYPMGEASARAAAALLATGASFQVVNILADPLLRAGLPHFSNLPTFPLLFVHGELIGGCKVIEELESAGELARIMAEVAGI